MTPNSRYKLWLFNSRTLLIFRSSCKLLAPHTLKAMNVSDIQLQLSLRHRCGWLENSNRASIMRTTGSLSHLPCIVLCTSVSAISTSESTRPGVPICHYAFSYCAVKWPIKRDSKRSATNSSHRHSPSMKMPSAILEHSSKLSVLLPVPFTTPEAFQRKTTILLSPKLPCTEANS